MIEAFGELEYAGKVTLITDMLLEAALLGWVSISIYMATRFLRDRIMLLLLVAGLVSFSAGAVANIYEHLYPLSLWQHVFLVDFAHCGGYVFFSSSVGYLVFRYMRLHEALQREAFSDFLTGLANRRYFYQRLEEAVARYHKQGEPFGVAVLDVDDLKEVNDRHGHIQGDEILKEVARALRRAVRATDCVARFGGDEFAVLFVGAANEEGVIDRLLGELRQCSVGASFGTAFCPRDGTTTDALVAAADNRMYAMKAEKSQKKGSLLSAGTE
ncbi:MAG: GGDEF domain-containing protein [Bacillota bacterium]